MAFKFTDAARYPYRDGGLFLGADDQGREVGIVTDKHLLCIGSARTGKGAALIIPNLLRWKGSVLNIDPKAENANATAAAREDMGQHTGLLDPYLIAKGRAADLRVSINPLAVLDPESIGFRADLEALSDGFIRRHDPKHEDWADTACRYISAFADYFLSTMERGSVTLHDIRGCFLLKPDDLASMAEAMATTPTFAGLAAEGATILRAMMADGESLEAQAFSKAVKELGWIGDPAFSDMLGGGDLPTFDMSTLKAGNGTLYLCIPPKYLKERGTFLRLFVSMGLIAMMEELDTPGSADGKCLFILDEMHSLGRLDLAVKAAGLTPGYGIRLFPFFQDIGQLWGLYGPNEGQTFFASADAHIFFGNADSLTLNYISQELGVVTQADIGAMPPTQTPLYVHPDRAAAAYDPLRPPTPISSPIRNTGKAGSLGQIAAVTGFAVNSGLAAAHHLRTVEQSRERQAIEREERAHAAKDQNAMRDYQDKMARKGEPHLKPSEIRDLVAKHDGDLVARSMIVVAKGSDFLNLRLVPYFMPAPAPLPEKPLPPHVVKAWESFFMGHFDLEREKKLHEQRMGVAIMIAAAVWIVITIIVIMINIPFLGAAIISSIVSSFLWYILADRSKDQLANQARRSARMMEKAEPVINAWEADNGPIKNIGDKLFL